MSKNQLVFCPVLPAEVNDKATWNKSNWKLGGVRVWFRGNLPGEGGNLHRVGRYGDQYFYGWNSDRVPNLIRLDQIPPQWRVDHVSPVKPEAEANA
jgi:hypothetical protein